MDKAATDGRKGVDAVERALQLLDCFDGSEGALPLAELSRRTCLYKSTILRLAVSLERFGHIVRQADGRYRLGPTAWRLGAAYRRNFDVGEVIRPELERLATETGETASYYARDGDGRVCLFRREPTRAIRHSIVEGARMPLDRGASGRVLLAYSADPAEAAAHADVSAAGWAVSLGERDPEVASVAIPLFDRDGRAPGALAVSGLVTRFSDERVREILAALRESRERLTATGT